MLALKCGGCLPSVPGKSVLKVANCFVAPSKVVLINFESIAIRARHAMVKL